MFNPQISQLFLSNKKIGRDCSLPSLRLYLVNYICIYNFRCTITDIIHLLHPQHHISCFEFFVYIFFFGKFFYQPEKHIGCLLLDVIKVCDKFA